MNEILKFAKIVFRNLKFLSKGRQGDSSYEAVPLSPFLNPPNPSHVRGACISAGALHAVYHQASVRQILKFMSEHITLPNSVASDNET
ncbi:hypothetical protein YZ70_02670 [Campylobacter concisus]|uniref:hypothetical protein n=1 Tax=Campylobacter concisus TaxID=199 RepID=UPI00188299DD|nr:hypothetical protein [Campylobacter concisus]MBE8584414.1 hypothetical protein [Campylobacter concisus]